MTDKTQPRDWSEAIERLVTFHRTTYGMHQMRREALAILRELDAQNQKKLSGNRASGVPVSDKVSADAPKRYRLKAVFKLMGYCPEDEKYIHLSHAITGAGMYVAKEVFERDYELVDVPYMIMGGMTIVLEEFESGPGSVEHHHDIDVVSKEQAAHGWWKLPEHRRLAHMDFDIALGIIPRTTNGTHVFFTSLNEGQIPDIMVTVQRIPPPPKQAPIRAKPINRKRYYYDE